MPAAFLQKLDGADALARQAAALACAGGAHSGNDEGFRHQDSWLYW